MSGCEGCLPNERERQGLIIQKEIEAKEYAVERQTLVVLYWLSDSQVGYMVADQAKAAGVSPIKFVSHLR